MKHRIDIRGPVIPNDYKFYYDFFGMDSTCPNDVKSVLDAVQPGDEVEVYINSGGGVIDVGSEIYTMLRGRSDVKIYITGEACSAASIVAMAAYCEMSPTALMMVHCVSTGANGNHSTMEHTAEILKTADQALSNAYVSKSGMSHEEVLEMMNHETWLTAEQAKEKHLIDAVMFDENSMDSLVAAGTGFELPSSEMLGKIKDVMERTDAREAPVFLLQHKLKFLKLRGEKR